MKYELNPKYEHFKDDLLNVSSFFEGSPRSIHKARNELRIADIQDTEVVIKAFMKPHIFNRLAYTFFRDSKARKSFKNALELQRLGVSTPDAIGYIEFLGGGLITQSYFLSAYTPYDFTIREVFRHRVDNYQDIIKAFATFTFKLHQKGVWHIDYSPGNILVKQESGDYHFSLVDINRLRFAPIKAYEGLENFSKFWAEEEDLRLLARTYAELANLDIKKAETIALEEGNKVRNKTEIKRRLKNKKRI